jgi:hypothetical protein
MMLRAAGRAAWCLFLVGGIACGTNPSGAALDPTFTDGSRLVAQQFSFPGTAPLFAGIYDRQESVACQFRPASDGSLRCLPDAAAGETPERWVSGVAMPGPATGLRLQRYEINSADGGRFPNWWNGELYDADAGEPCVASVRDEQVDGTGVGVCMPRSASTGNFFADAACTEALAITPDTSPLPLLAVALDNQLYAIGEQWTGPMFLGLGGSCTEFVPSGTRAFRTGASLPADTVPSLQIAPRGDGRLAVQIIEAQGVGLTTVRYQHLPFTPSATTGPYWDRDLGIACWPMPTVDHETLCAPADATVETRPDLLGFGDPACTQRVIGLDRAFAIFAMADPGRALAFEVHRIAGPPTSTGYVVSDAGCTEYPKGSGYPVGETVPLASFARLTAKP